MAAIPDTAASTPWAVRVPIHATELLGRLRLQPGIRVLVETDSIWLRGDDLDDRLANRLRMLAEGERFFISDDGQLTVWDETVPRATLPSGRWQPLADWLTVELPRAAFAAKCDDRIELSLARSSEIATPNLIRADWAIWSDYAVTAPQLRLNQWSFAASSRCQALIRGTPLPPIPGDLFVESGRIAIPAGWRTDPPLDPQLIRQVISLPDDCLALFNVDGPVEVIRESDFVRATRSAVRLTDKNLKPA